MFRRLLDRHRRDDGSRWTYAVPGRATGGVAEQRFLSELGRGAIHDPGYLKVYAISVAMGFPVEDWLDER